MGLHLTTTGEREKEGGRKTDPKSMGVGRRERRIVSAVVGRIESSPFPTGATKEKKAEGGSARPGVYEGKHLPTSPICPDTGEDRERERQL